ncbi:AAA family ATPase [Corynebacterium sp. HMSC22B11]|nr:AAA family ATPase [Corynebacterium sp. HMSC22B11]
MYTSHMESPMIDDATPWLPEDVAEALEAIWNGDSAGNVESETLEIKEDPARVQYAPSKADKHRAQLVEKLIDEAVCLANGESAMGHIIVGISDKLTGPEAFTGTDLDTLTIERKILHGTQQQLRVEASELEYHGSRLVVIRIPEALTMYTRTQGQAKRRRGTSCEPLLEAERQALVRERANPDYSNGSSRLQVQDIELPVLEEARRLLRGKRSREDGSDYVPKGANGLLRELGLVGHDGSLKRAAEILMLPPDKPALTVQYFWRPIVGADPEVSEISEPLLTALPRLRRLIRERASQEIERVQFDDGQETAIPRFPAQAIDEAVTNAFIHRDWQISRPVVVDQTPRTLKIWSPGPLPPGVDRDHLLTTQSVPRNSRLMAVMRGLGLAEESSRGFDRMWSAMIGTGREVPEVRAEETFVEVILSAGKPDVGFIKMLHELEKLPDGEAVRSVGTLIVLKQLWSAPRITKNQVERLAQISSMEAAELMESLQDIGVVARLQGADEWVLGRAVQQGTASSGGAQPQFASAATMPTEEWLEEQLRTGTVRAAEAAEILGIERSEVTKILRKLRERGVARIDPAGPQRGSNTRWIGASE